MDTFLKCLAGLTEDQIIEDPVAVAQLFTFDLGNPQVAAIQSSVVMLSEHEIYEKVDAIEILGGDWPGLVSFIRNYAYWCAIIDPEHPERCFEWYAKCYQSLQQAYSNSRGACLNLAVRDLTLKMIRLFSYLGKNHLDFVSGILIRLLNSVRSEREPITPNAPAKKDNILFYANMLSRIYFKADQLVSAGSVYSNMHSVGVVLSQFTMAEQVEYRYWIGRHAIYRCDALSSFANLKWALDHCLYPSPQYSLIWDWILMPGILVGKLPTSQAIKETPPSRVEAFQAITLALSVVKLGRLTEDTLKRLKANAWVRSKNLWPLIQQHLPQMAYRRVLQLIHKHLIKPRIPFKLIRAVLKIDDPELLKTEGILYGLIENDLVKGKILTNVQHCLLKGTGAFPPIDTSKSLTDADAWMAS